MPRLTTCPHCHTTFRVTDAQLASHGGDVRCGKCARVFNALEQGERPEPQEMPAPLPLFETAAAAAAAPPLETPLPAEPAPPPEPEAEPLPPDEPAAFRPESVPEPEASPPTLSRVTSPREAESTVGEPISRLEMPPAAPITRERPAGAGPSTRSAKPASWELPPPKPKPRRWPYILGSLVLLVALALQGTYLFRSQIALAVPAAKPLLVQACDALGCRIELPRNPDLWNIETSDLQADPAHPSVIVLTAVLRNRATHPQPYPLLELTLTDAKDEVVARRVFTPAEYLRQGADQVAGAAASGDVNVRLQLELKDLPAVGYRLYLFYA